MAIISQRDLELALRDLFSGTARTEDFRDALHAATVLSPDEVKNALLVTLRASR